MKAVVAEIAGSALLALPTLGLLLFWLSAVGFFTAVPSIAPANADTCELYMCEKAPGRRALVIGNSDYSKLEPIPSADDDATAVAKQLAALGFEVTQSVNVKSERQFEYEVLPSFANKIEKGDLVVFYFSGHGFSYGPGNYITPTDIPLAVEEKKLEREAISLEAIEDYLAGRDPGLILMLSDACRSYGSFVVKDARGANVVSKGITPQQQRDASTNTIIGFAARPGHIAVGASSDGVLSAFTKALDKRLPDERDFYDMFEDVMLDVSEATHDEQEPGFFAWSKTTLYLNASKSVLEQQAEAWRAAYGSGLRESITRFAKKHAVSNYAWAARQWLDDHPEAESVADFTLVPPTSIEQAWGQRNTRISLVRTPWPIAFTRSIELVHPEEISSWSGEIIGAVPSGTKAADLLRNPALKAQATDLDRINAYGAATGGDAVVTSSTVAYSLPLLSAEPVRLQYGDPVKILSVADLPGWLRVYLQNEARVAYLPKPGDGALEPLELGKPLLEVDVPPRAGSIPDLVDSSAVDVALAAIQTAGRKISWVSMVTAATDDLDERDHRAARLDDVKLILTDQGVDSQRITAVSGYGDYEGDGVRVRIFGY